MNLIKKTKQMKLQNGVSLVEIMVAMVISIFLLGGVIQVYIGNKSTYRFSDATSRIQENARFALDTVVSDTRMVGYWGCAQFELGGGTQRNKHIRNNLNAGSVNYSANIHAFKTNAAISLTVNDGLNGSDSLTLRATDAGQNIIKAAMANDQSDIELSDKTSIKINDIVIISNCHGADVFEVTSKVASSTAGQTVLGHSTTAQASTPGNRNIAADNCTAGSPNHCLSQIYDTTSAISILQTVTYSIQVGASGEPALWRSVNGVDVELIEGVEEMQVSFGIDTDDDGSPNQYLSDAAAVAANSQQITAIRVFLVVRSDQNNITDIAQVYNVNGIIKTAADRRLRQVFSSTIALRNRLR